MAQQNDDRIECLDGLRGFAASWVLVGHAMLLTGWMVPIVSRAELAVDLFILLSGFLMAFHYLLREQQEPWDSPSTWGRFWTRRFFRIAPLYYVLLAAALLLGPMIGHARADLAVFLPKTATPPERYFDQGLDNILAHASFVFGQLPHYAFRTALPDWSIGLEMAFYAAFPFIMLLSKKLSLPVTAVLLGFGSLALVKLAPGLADGFEKPAFLPLKLHIFLAGMLIAAARERSARASLVLVALAVVLSLGSLRGGSTTLMVRAILTAGLAFLVVGPRFDLVRTVAVRLDAFLGLKPFRFAGDISYGVYLIHLLILIPTAAFVAKLGLPPVVRFAAAAGVTLAASVPLAWLGYRLIERNGIEWGKQILRGRKRPIGQAAADAPPTA